ncbi:MAG: hypothetical protein AAF945_11700 [Actinomycetota bacterium]
MSDRPSSPFVPAVADARARVGRAYRQLGHAISGHLIELEELARLADDLERWMQSLEERPRRDRVTERPTGDWGPAPASGELMYSFDERPVSGRSAPLGFDVEVRREDREAVGRLTLGPAHEGAPGRSHGGIVAALFDDLFGFVLTIEQQAAFTGELGIRYEAGTPIGVPLACRVRLAERDGRKMKMDGELTVEGPAPLRLVPSRPGEPANDPPPPGTVVARATATFIAVDPEQFRVT